MLDYDHDRNRRTKMLREIVKAKSERLERILHLADPTFLGKIDMISTTCMPLLEEVEGKEVSAAFKKGFWEVDRWFIEKYDEFMCKNVWFKRTKLPCPYTIHGKHCEIFSKRPSVSGG